MYKVISFILHLGTLRCSWIYLPFGNTTMSPDLHTVWEHNDLYAHGSFDSLETTPTWNSSGCISHHRIHSFCSCSQCEFNGTSQAVEIIPTWLYLIYLMPSKNSRFLRIRMNKNSTDSESISNLRKSIKYSLNVNIKADHKMRVRIFFHKRWHIYKCLFQRTTDNWESAKALCPLGFPVRVLGIPDLTRCMLTNCKWTSCLQHIPVTQGTMNSRTIWEEVQRKLLFLIE